MNWITNAIAIGNCVDARDADLLRSEAIVSILGLTRTLEGVDPQSLGVREIHLVPLEDGPGNELAVFRDAVHLLGRLVETGPPVLVHCQGGTSRAVVVVAAHLMRVHGLEPEVALAQVGAKRESAVSPALERLLEELARFFGS